MVSEEVLISCFCNLGCDVPDKFVVDKCLQLCHDYDINEETFVELWVAYSIPRSLDINPTLDDLNNMENEELKKNNTNFTQSIEHVVSSMEIDNQSNEEAINNVLDLYGAGQSSSKQTKRVRSPTVETDSNSKIRAVSQTFSPSTYTSKANVPNRAPSINVRGKVLLYFGPNVGSWKNRSEQDVSISKDDNFHMPKDAVYMYEMLSKQGAALCSRCESFGERLCHIWNEMGPANSNTRYVRNVLSVSQVPFRTWGRISTMTDTSAGNNIVTLEGCRRSKGDNNAPVVWLDLSGIKHYSVFPGQIVAVEGTNAAGNSLLAKELFVNGYAPLVEAPKLIEDLKVYVAVGPFTPSDNLNYQPLWDLMEQVAQDEPNILILIGPFIDYTHPEIQKCTLKDTYQDFFDQILLRVMQCLQGKHTRVVLVPSNRDAHHDPVFPTPEFTIYANKLGSNASNLYAMPDPCIINVDGLQIGITSVDIVRHLGQHEISNTSGMDRIGRLANHVLSQNTFYPLYPPFAGLNLDTTLWKKYGCFERQPHMMILPSDIKYYCKVVNECVVLNPERLQKYMYAKLCIRPNSDGKWSPHNVSCEIAKV